MTTSGIRSSTYDRTAYGDDDRTCADQIGDDAEISQHSPPLKTGYKNPASQVEQGDATHWD